MNTTKTPKTDALIASLTIEQAREFFARQDGLIWIETTLLDPVGINRRQAERVETALLDLLMPEYEAAYEDQYGGNEFPRGEFPF
jgi:hypothetical protein